MRKLAQHTSMGISTTSTAVIPPPKSANLLANQPEVSSSCAIFPNPSHCNKILWHQKLSHASDDVLNHLDLGMKFDIKPCDFCHKVKQHRQPFHKSVVHVVNLFDLVHMDLWGPYKLPTSSGCTYFLTMVDDHSRSIWTFLMFDKMQTHNIIEKFILSCKNQFQSTINPLELIMP